MITSVFVERTSGKVLRTLQMHDAYIINSEDEYSFAIEGQIQLDFTRFEYVYTDGHIQSFPRGAGNA